MVLNIFEPKYVSMYNDILMTGSRSFAVFARDPEDKNQLAAVGLSLYLTELKEVSRETNGAVKYQCTHNVTGRVRLHGVLNPVDVLSPDAYVKAEVSDLVDVDDDVNTTALEAAAVSALYKVAEVQEANDAQVRFNKTMVEQLQARRGMQTDSLWAMQLLWTAFLDVRATELVRKIQNEAPLAGLKNPKRLVNSWIAGEVIEDPSASESEQAAIRSMLRRLQEDVDPLMLEKSNGNQLMLQSDQHAERLHIFIELIESEAARQRLSSMFKSAFGSA